MSRHVVCMTIDDVEHYTQEEKDRIVASYPEHEREARAKGVPTMGSGRVFPVSEESIRVDPFETDRKLLLAPESRLRRGVNYLQNKYGFNDDYREQLHEEITGQNLTRSEIDSIARTYPRQISPPSFPGGIPEE